MSVGTFALELAERIPECNKLLPNYLKRFRMISRANSEPIAAHCADAPAPTAAELAETLLGTLEGSIVLAKAHRDPTRIPRAIRGFRLSLAGVVLAASPNFLHRSILTSRYREEMNDDNDPM